MPIFKEASTEWQGEDSGLVSEPEVEEERQQLCHSPVSLVLKEGDTQVCSGQTHGQRGRGLVLLEERTADLFKG